MVARGLLNSISDRADYVPVFINFSAQTSSQRTQEMIESKLEKRRKTALGKLQIQVTCFQVRERVHSHLRFTQRIVFSVSME